MRVAALQVYGLRISLSVPEDFSVEPILLPDWQPLADAAAQPGDLRLEIRPTTGHSQSGSGTDPIARWEVIRDNEVFALAADAWHAMRMLDQALHISIAEFSPTHVFFHAGAVGWKGRVIVTPGRSMHGKSTLTLALVEEGAVFFSDEFAVVDPQGLVSAYPKALSQRRAGGSPRQIPATELGWNSSITPCPCGMVAAIRYSTSARELQLQEISVADAVMALLDNCVGVRRAPERSLRAAARLAGEAVNLKGLRAEAAPCARLLLQRF